jgi:DNA-directed RNA polymerase alpha subunit
MIKIYLILKLILLLLNFKIRGEMTQSEQVSINKSISIRMKCHKCQIALEIEVMQNFKHLCEQDLGNRWYDEI